MHVPAGAIPKDGPSAGVTMFTALASLLTGKPVRRDVAMTGEITLRGNVLPVGGIKEKILAAHRAGIKRVIMPERNQKDLIDVPEQAKNEMEFFSSSGWTSSSPLALTEMPEKFGATGDGAAGAWSTPPTTLSRRACQPSEQLVVAQTPLLRPSGRQAPSWRPCFVCVIGYLTPRRR